MSGKGFSAEERTLLLTVKGVGATVISRLEQMGIHSLAQLAQADVETVLTGGAALTGSSCWKNSPQARAAIQAAIEKARQSLP